MAYLHFRIWILILIPIPIRTANQMVILYCVELFKSDSDSNPNCQLRNGVRIGIRIGMKIFEYKESFSIYELITLLGELFLNSYAYEMATV